jgi:hypothetical protein
MIDEKTKESLSDDEILWLARIITGEERKIRNIKANNGHPLREPETNPREQQYRPIVEWIRKELKLRPKRLWCISQFELGVDYERVVSASGIDKPKESFGANYSPRAFVRLAGYDAEIRSLLEPVGISYLWDLIHEFGHVLIGSPENEESIQCFGARCTVKRERNAWKKGWAEVKGTFGDHLTERDYESYKDHRNTCLRSYWLKKVKQCGEKGLKLNCPE